MAVVHSDPAFAEVLVNALVRASHRSVAMPSGTLLGGDAPLVADAAIVGLGDSSDTTGLRIGGALCSLGVPFVYVTASTRLEDRLAGFDAGAEDVLVQPVALPELAARLRVVLRRSRRRRELRIGDIVVDEQAHTVTASGEPVEFTSIEFALLLALFQNPGHILSKTQLLFAVWGTEHFDINVVEVHVSALRRKLERTGPRIVHTVRGVGYVLRAPDARQPVRLVAG